MRRQWWTALAVSLALGCTGPSAGQPGAQLAMQGGAGSWSGTSSTHSGAPTSTWGKLVAAVTPGSSTTSGPPGLTAADVQRRQNLDRLSLTQPVGAPTPELYVAMARVSERGGNAEQARALYHKAIEHDAERFDAHLGLARLEDRSGRFDQALQHYHRCAALRPDNPTVFNDLGLCYARAGELPRSLSALDRATRIAPENPLYRNNIAKLLVEMNLVNDALAHQVAVHPQPIAQYNVGSLLQQRNRSDEAVFYLTAALAADPSLTPAQELLDEIGGMQSASTMVANVVAGSPRSPHAVAQRPEGSLAATESMTHRGKPRATPMGTGVDSSSILPTPRESPWPASPDNQPMLLPPVE